MNRSLSRCTTKDKQTSTEFQLVPSLPAYGGWSVRHVCYSRTLNAPHPAVAIRLTSSITSYLVGVYTAPGGPGSQPPAKFCNGRAGHVWSKQDSFSTVPLLCLHDVIRCLKLCSVPCARRRIEHVLFLRDGYRWYKPVLLYKLCIWGIVCFHRRLFLSPRRGLSILGNVVWSLLFRFPFASFSSPLKAYGMPVTERERFIYEQVTG